MSMLIAAASPYVSLQEDLRLLRPDMRQIGAIFADFLQPISGISFATEWWPGGGLQDDSEGAFGSVVDGAPFAWGWFDPAGEGGSSRFGFVGVTRDQNGTPAGNCEVKLFRSSDHALIDLTTSDPVGNFLLNTPYYPDQHYIVCHKVDGPVISGASVKTLIGT
jgi:hypothetical protein